jgi:hypothetical protein
MKQFRLAAAAATIACAMLLGGAAGTAAAQTPTTQMAQKVPITGEGKNGKEFNGTFAIKRFIERKGQAWAVGTLRGKLKNRNVTRRGVRIPAAIVAPASTSSQPLPVPTPGACQVLNLVLGPINLNLLGLRVATNEVRLLIEAVPGAGNLLGNLLCAVTNLLNPSANTPLGQLVQVLNALLALSPRTPATPA